MVNRILHGLSKGRGSKFHVDSQVQQETSEEGRRTHRLDRCEYNNKDEDKRPKTINDKNNLFDLVYNQRKKLARG